MPGRLSLGLWIGLLVLMFVSLLMAIIPPTRMLELFDRLGMAWVYAAACMVAALSARSLEVLVWDAPDSWLGQRLVDGAFRGVSFLLRLLYNDVVVDAGTKILGTGRFRIRVAGTCSGIESLALMLVLTAG